MRNLTAVAFLFLFLTSFIHAATILSPYSIDFDNGDGTHTVTVYSAPTFAQDDNGNWDYFTNLNPMTADNNGVNISVSDGKGGRILGNLPRLPAACSNYGLKKGSGVWEFLATCNLPAGQGTILRNFSSIVASRFIGGTAFYWRNTYWDFANWNIQNTTYNTSVQFTNFSDGHLQVNLSWWSNQSQTIELDPFISAAPSDDLYLTKVTLNNPSWIYIKFKSNIIPANQRILDAALYLNQPAINTGVCWSNVSVSNITADWNITDTFGKIYGLPFTFTNWSNVSVASNSSGRFILNWPWAGFNVTPSFAYAYANGFNASYLLNSTTGAAPNLAVINTNLQVGNQGISCATTGGLTTTNIVFNSSRAVGGYTPQLNITYLALTAPTQSKCDDGSWIVNKSANAWFYANQSGLTCQVRVISDAETIAVNYTNAAESLQVSQWYYANFTLSQKGVYEASFNCSNGFVESQNVGVVNSCSSTTLLSSGTNTNTMDGLDWGIIPFLITLAFFLTLAALYRRSAILFLGVSVILLFTAYTVFTEVPHEGITQIVTANTTANYSYDANGAITGSNTITTQSLVPLQQNTNQGIAVGILAAAIGIAAFAAYKMFFGNMEV